MSKRELAVQRAAAIAAVNAYFDALESMAPARAILRPSAENDGDSPASDIDVARARRMREQRGKR